MIEIERKFLLNDIPDLSGYSSDEIEQAYLSFEPEIRIRKKGSKFFITMKGEGSLSRTEVEKEIDSTIYEILINLLQGRLIKKTRCKIGLKDGLVAELDVYHEKLEGLYTVETEFRSEEQASLFELPVWFGKEITEDKRYKNKNLARNDDIKDLIPSSGYTRLLKK